MELTTDLVPEILATYSTMLADTNQDLTSFYGEKAKFTTDVRKLGPEDICKYLRTYKAQFKPLSNSSMIVDGKYIVISGRCQYGPQENLTEKSYTLVIHNKDGQLSIVNQMIWK